MSYLSYEHCHEKIICLRNPAIIKLPKISITGNTQTSSGCHRDLDRIFPVVVESCHFLQEVTVSIIKYVYCLWVDDDVAWFSVDGGLSGGAIAGIVIGVIVILVLIAVAVVCFCKSRQSKADSFEGWYSYSTILTCQCRFTQC